MREWSYIRTVLHSVKIYVVQISLKTDILRSSELQKGFLKVVLSVGQSI